MGRVRAAMRPPVADNNPSQIALTRKAQLLSALFCVFAAMKGWLQPGNAGVSFRRNFNIMADDNKKEKKGGELRVPPRTWILWIAILGAIPLLLLFKDPRDNQKHLSQKEFIEYLRSGAIKDGIIWFNVQDPLTQDITGNYIPPGKEAKEKFKTLVHLDEALDKEVRES